MCERHKTLSLLSWSRCLNSPSERTTLRSIVAMQLKTLSIFVAVLLQMIGFVSACNAWCTCINPDGSHFCTCRSKKGIGPEAGSCPCCTDLSLDHKCCATLDCGQRFKCSAAQVSSPSIFHGLMSFARGLTYSSVQGIHARQLLSAGAQ